MWGHLRSPESEDLDAVLAPSATMETTETLELERILAQDDDDSEDTDQEEGDCMPEALETFVRQAQETLDSALVQPSEEEEEEESEGMDEEDDEDEDEEDDNYIPPSLAAFVKQAQNTLDSTRETFLQHDEASPSQPSVFCFEDTTDDRGNTPPPLEDEEDRRLHDQLLERFRQADDDHYGGVAQILGGYSDAYPNDAEEVLFSPDLKTPPPNPHYDLTNSEARHMALGAAYPPTPLLMVDTDMLPMRAPVRDDSASSSPMDDTDHDQVDPISWLDEALHEKSPATTRATVQAPPPMELPVSHVGEVDESNLDPPPSSPGNPKSSKGAPLDAMDVDTGVQQTNSETRMTKSDKPVKTERREPVKPEMVRAPPSKQTKPASTKPSPMKTPAKRPVAANASNTVSSQKSTRSTLTDRLSRPTTASLSARKATPTKTTPPTTSAAQAVPSSPRTPPTGKPVSTVPKPVQSSSRTPPAGTPGPTTPKPGRPTARTPPTPSSAAVKPVRPSTRTPPTGTPRSSASKPAQPSTQTPPVATQKKSPAKPAGARPSSTSAFTPARVSPQAPAAKAPSTSSTTRKSPVRKPVASARTPATSGSKAARTTSKSSPGASTSSARQEPNPPASTASAVSSSVSKGIQRGRMPAPASQTSPSTRVTRTFKQPPTPNRSRPLAGPVASRGTAAAQAPVKSTPPKRINTDTSKLIASREKAQERVKLRIAKGKVATAPPRPAPRKTQFSAEEGVARARERLRLRQLKEQQARKAKENHNVTKVASGTLGSVSTKSKRVLTIPQGPKLSASRRVSNKLSPITTAQHSNHPRRTPSGGGGAMTLAQSTDILRKGLRSDDMSVGSHSSIRRELTIATAPKFATSARHVDPEKTPRWRAESTLASSSRLLQNQLRGADRSLSRNREMKLTVPQAPKFHAKPKRALPLSTEERELEMMKQINSVPFKARPYRNGMVPSATPVAHRSAHRSVMRPVTQPKPFHFRSVKRGAAAQPKIDPKVSEDENEMKKKFHARPMPSFSRPFQVERKSLSSEASPEGEIARRQKAFTRPNLSTASRAEKRMESAQSFNAHAEQTRRHKEEEVRRRQREKHVETMRKAQEEQNAELLSPRSSSGPFQLHSQARHEVYQRRLEERVQQEQEQEKMQAEFHAMEYHSAPPPEKKKSPRKATSQEPFHLESEQRHFVFEEKARQKIIEAEQEVQKAAEFKARPVPQTTYASPTAQSFLLASTARLHAQEEERRKREEAESEELRKMQFRARPVPQTTYQYSPPRASSSSPDRRDDQNRHFQTMNAADGQYGEVPMPAQTIVFES